MELEAGSVDATGASHMQSLGPQLDILTHGSGVGPKTLHFRYHSLIEVLKKKQYRTYTTAVDTGKEKYSRSGPPMKGSEEQLSRMIQWSEGRREELDGEQSRGSAGSWARLRSRTLGNCPYLEPRFSVLVARGPAVYEASVCQDHSFDLRPRGGPGGPGRRSERLSGTHNAWAVLSLSV